MVILICICIIFILLMIHVLWPIYVYDPQYYKLDVVTNTDLQTGDILFVRNCTKCKYNDDFMNNGFQWVYRNMFNSLRWYITKHSPYTHTAVIIRLNIEGEEKPYICHMDGGMPMYDVYRNKYISGTGVVVSNLQYVDTCGGVAHIYKYKGPRIKKNMLPWIESNNNSKYPSSMYKLMMANALKWDTHPKGVMACTDFVENTLNNMGITNKNLSNQSTINDIVEFVHGNNQYDSTPLVLKNKCYNAKHFE
jgi:hypothetical protein